MGRIDFKGRVAIVTGAGGGLGKTYALELARRGCSVVVNDPGVARDGTGGGSAMADQVVEEIRSFGGQAVASYEGVQSKAGGEAIVASALDRFGRLDILIHNAGIIRDRSFAKMSEEEWRGVIDVHLNGAFYVAQPAWRAMRENRYGRIVLTTSVSGLFGNFGQANYAAAKMGLVGLMHVLAIEGSKYGIHANGISPTALTRMTEDLMREGAPPVSRDPEHVTPAVLYLVSEDCQESGIIIHAGHGFFGRIGVSYDSGIFLGERPVSPERVADHWQEIVRFRPLQAQPSSAGYLAHVYEKASRPS